ncbi:MAG: chemotaxis protein CheW [Planctomycetes bacterium]|nr:chemotaxis protein CheW [Planctomycetota bacterium]
MALSQVGEVMRILEVGSLPNIPPYVLGLCTIRGKPTPVVALPALLDQPEGERLERYVTLRIPRGTLALAVPRVLGLADLSTLELERLPPLLTQVRAEVVDSIAIREQALLLVLQAGRILPDEIWNVLPVEASIP